MKNLANCNVREFLTQTNKIRKSVANWLSLTQILEIRKNMPVFTDDVSEEERKKAMTEQAKKNFSDMLDSILDKYPDETAEMLGLMCFIEPKDLNKHKMTELFSSFNEMINCEEVISFFISLVSLAKKAGFGTQKG